MLKFKDIFEDKKSELELVKFFIKQLYLYSQTSNKKEEVKILLDMLYALPINQEDLYSIKTIRLKDKEEELLALLEQIYMIPNILSQRKFMVLLCSLLIGRGYDFNHLMLLLNKKG